MEKKEFLMRSLMFVPGHNEKLLVSASKSNADILLFDVEDSVLPDSNKEIARKKIKEYVTSGIYKNFDLFVRINERISGHLLNDVYQLTLEEITGFLYSKTYTKEDIIFFDKLLETIEYEKGFPIGKFKIIPILETAASIINADEIAKASSRVVAIGFGSEDFISDLEGIRDFDESVSIFSARAWVAMVARANKVIPIDAAYIHVHDIEGLEKHLQKGRLLGYAGMWVLHPKQNELANKYYSPSPEEVQNAYEMLRIYEMAQKDDKGVAIIEGKFIGPPIVVAAKKTIKKHELIESRRKLIEG